MGGGWEGGVVWSMPSLHGPLEKKECIQGNPNLSYKVTHPIGKMDLSSMYARPIRNLNMNVTKDEIMDPIYSFVLDLKKLYSLFQ